MTDISNNSDVVKKFATGWICPVCGSGIAPWVNKCPCMNVMKITNDISEEIDWSKGTHPRER